MQKYLNMLLIGESKELNKSDKVMGTTLPL